MADRQRATALYFIDKLALRAGNEKGEDEADTVGCCSLRYEHVTLEPPNRVIFDFLGKDSMRFHQEVEVDKQVFKNIKIFKDNKTKGDDIFDRLNVSGLRSRMFDHRAAAGRGYVADEIVLDHSAQQPSPSADARPERQGVPYLQRFVDVPAATEEHAQKRHGAGEDRRVQHCEQGGGHPV
jgi:hypothetical protein